MLHGEGCTTRGTELRPRPYADIQKPFQKPYDTL